MSQLELDLQVPVQDLQTRRYWEYRRPGGWEAVRVRVRYGRTPPPAERGPVLPHVRTGVAAPRNVLVERADGSTAVRPVRVLRTRRPGPAAAGKTQRATPTGRPGGR